MKKIVLIATLVLKNSKNEGIMEALTALHKATHKEDKGCLQYDVHKDIEKENTYVFVETWESEALLAAHMEKEHFNAYKTFLGDKVESLSLQKLEKIL
ncbi:putative quinol monooxygenase [Sulfurospirillum arsenophilum]|uniref:putative quinol monooxygenase n=1 Tax=Sulfurospirillum arsenophilum TaxID=56698 RepID=UPI0005A73CB0|nr:putative quinol monooxygenase [Sulfurospirillum arsenophilum]